MSQIHLTYINTTESGINMMISWVRDYPIFVTTYNIIFPIIGISIITTAMGIVYYKSNNVSLFDCYVYQSSIYNFTSRDTVTCGYICVYTILFICCILSGIRAIPVTEQVTYCNPHDTCFIQFPTNVAMLSQSKTVYSAPMYNLSPRSKYKYRIAESKKTNRIYNS